MKANNTFVLRLKHKDKEVHSFNLLEKEQKAHFSEEPSLHKVLYGRKALRRRMFKDAYSTCI